MSDTQRVGTIRWFAVVVIAGAAALLIAWLARLADVPLRVLLDIGIGVVALAWLIGLVTAPWNLYFAARAVIAESAVSRERGIDVPQRQEAEARRIARRMLWFALGGHVLTAAATAVVAVATGAVAGYYLSGFYLFAAAIRPAVAYFAHLRRRISALSRESLHPRDDVVSLRAAVRKLGGTVRELSGELPAVRRDLTEDLRRTEARLAGAQEADRERARTREEELAGRIDLMVRRMQETMDGVSDHQELQAGIRALVRMIRADGAQ
jgi:hypothetical protein